MPIDISRALAIPGWMSEEELSWLAETGSKSRFAVEIGTYLGRSARAIAENMVFEGAYLLCVDSFSGGEGTEHEAEKWKNIRSECWKNLSDLPATRVTILNRTSLEASENWDEFVNIGDLDFVFIDGDHSYKAVRQDIEQWFPKLCDGGILSGHDYDVWPGVNQAVDEFCYSTRREIGKCGSIWFTRK